MAPILNGSRHQLWPTLERTRPRSCGEEKSTLNSKRVLVFLTEATTRAILIGDCDLVLLVIYGKKVQWPVGPPGQRGARVGSVSTITSDTPLLQIWKICNIVGCRRSFQQLQEQLQNNRWKLNATESSIVVRIRGPKILMGKSNFSPEFEGVNCLTF
ncbi:uncharacterized protein [Procambarus clarkii]|uniref:uncharacterized protein isoform X2 n=1 Tax=Procambarus clarkii TaxID=6728 RepID=UPI003743D8B9